MAAHQPESHPALVRHGNLISGEWAAATEGRHYSIRNPAKPQELLGEFADSSEDDGLRAIESAAKAAHDWAATPGPQRGAILFRFAQLLDESTTELARIVTLEQGKALAEAVGEVGRAAAEARFMAGEASRPIGQTFPSERPGFSCHTVSEPLGVVAAICPWNFPVVTPVRKIAPALAFGNAVVFKPSSLTPWSGVYLTQLLVKAGVPRGVVSLLTGRGSVIGDVLVRDSRVGGITFTGSTSIGTHIYELAARRLSRVQLELGGKNPAVVVDCGDLDGAAREIVAAAFLCSGQRCTALSRVIVAAAEADGLVNRILAHVARITVGDGLTPSTTMGPLVSEEQLRSVHNYVRIGIDSGCALLTGGKPLVDDPARQGFFYAPTVFDGVAPGTPLAQEEIFGPVLPVIRVRDLDEAITVANGTRYGLAASIFSSRSSAVHEFTTRVKAGMIHANHGTASQAHIPFGGVKDSGQGAYSIGPTAREFYTNAKTVYIKW